MEKKPTLNKGTIAALAASGCLPLFFVGHGGCFPVGLMALMIMVLGFGTDDFFPGIMLVVGYCSIGLAFFLRSIRSQRWCVIIGVLLTALGLWAMDHYIPGDLSYPTTIPFAVMFIIYLLKLRSLPKE